MALAWKSQTRLSHAFLESAKSVFNLGFIAPIAIIALLFFTSCEKKDSKNSTVALSPESTSWKPLKNRNQNPTVKVVDTSNQPVQGAKILVGSSRGAPFRDNFFETNASGIAEFSKAWNTELHVTVDAQNFIRQTLLFVAPGEITVKLNAAQLRDKAIIRGLMNGLPVVNGDKLIDFGLIMPSLSKSDLFNFDLSSVISPYGDTISAVGQEFSMPSNVALPTQKERYIINITLEKPEYRMYHSTLGQKRLFAASGRFPFKPVVDLLRDGKPFYELINFFDLTGGSIREINLNTMDTRLDFPAAELVFNKKIPVTSPQINPDEVFIALAASEIAGQLIPTGVRKLGSKESSELTSIEDKPLFLLSALKKQSEFMPGAPGADRISASLLPSVQNNQSELLQLLQNPTVVNTNGYQITMAQINPVAKVTPLATSIAISDVFEETTDSGKVNVLVKRWEILGTKWQQQVQLPNWPLDANPVSNKKRFEFNLVGGLNAKPIDIGDGLINSATHITRSSIDF